MIASLSYLMLYLAFGILSVRFLLPRHKPLNRIWLGLSLGVLEEMWLPALCAFLFGFGALAHAAAAGLLLLLTLLCYVLRDRRDPAPWDGEEKRENSRKPHFFQQAEAQAEPQPVQRLMPRQQKANRHCAE